MLRVARLFTPFFLILVLMAGPGRGISAQEAETGDETDISEELESYGEDVLTEENPDENIETEQPESSPFLLEMKVGDSDLDLLWNGYWRMNFVAGGGFGKLRQESIYTDLSRGTSFYQEPDVTLTLWMYDKWFIETTFLEGFDRNTYRAGFMGDSDDFVQEVVVGNSAVTATSYAEIVVPAPNYNTPGIAAKFATSKSEHEILVRFDPTDTQDKYFQGEFEVNTQDIGLPDFIEGKYFVLPDENVSNVQLYLEDRLGDFQGTYDQAAPRYFRLADPVEYFVDGTSGVLVLDDAHSGQVAVYYDTGFGPVGADSGTAGDNFVVKPDANYHPNLNPVSYIPFDFVGAANEYDPEGRTFDETLRVTLPAGDCLILYYPGRFTPFERQNIYESARPLPEETWRILPLVQNRGSLYPSTTTEYGFIPDTDEKIISVYGDFNSGMRDPVNRYPFAGSDPEVYGTGRETDMDKISRILVLAIRELNPGFSLGTGVVPGSVIIRVNGVRDKTAEIRDDGSIVFDRYIYLDDWIEVQYRTEVLDLNGGDFFLYQGNHFALTPRLNLELAESVRWNLSEDRTTEEFASSPGVIQVASTLDWEADNASIRLTGDASLTTPDTAGNLRLFGMEDDGLESVFLTETLVAPPSVYPGSAPEPGPSPSRRVSAAEFDYITSGILGGETLNDYLWPGATPTAEDKPGLAARRSDDPANWRVMEIRFDTDDSAGAGNGEWTTGDFLADYSYPINLSNYSTIEFPFMVRDDYGTGGAWPIGTWPGGTPQIWLQAGEIGESEDWQEDGVVNQADIGSFVEWDLSSVTVTDQVAAAWNDPGVWKTISISLSPADRARLTSVRAFRIMIINEAEQRVSGRYIMGAPEFAGSAFQTEIRDTSDELSSTSQDIVGDEVVDNSLMSLYPEVSVLFHPNNEDNEALRIRWGNDVGGTPIAANDRWEAVSWFDGIPMEGYRSLVFYVNYPGTAAVTSAEISDSDGKGISLTWTPSGTGWDKISIDIANGTARSDRWGDIPEVTIDSDGGELTRFVLSGRDAMGDSAGQQSGTVLLDEIYFTDPAYAVTGGTELQGYFRYDEDIAAVGSFPLLGNITVDGRAALAGGSVLSGLNRGSSAFAGSIIFGADILGIGFDTDWRGTWGEGRNEWSGSHNIRIPARSKSFWIEDIYARGDDDENISFSRGNRANFVFGAGNISFVASTLYEGIALVQGWGGETAWQGKHWHADLDIRYIVNTDNTPESSGNYLESWIRDYKYLLPADGAVSLRESHNVAELGLEFEKVSVSWTPELRIKVNRALSWKQENRWAEILTIPLKFERWTLSGSYRRDMKQVVDPGSQTEDFGDAWNVFANSMGGSFPLYTFVPFREFLGSKDGDTFNSVTEGMETADYETEFSVNMSRNAGSHILDLFLPATGDFSMERIYQRTGDTVGWKNQWRGSLGLRAINLFGRFGRYPFLNFYNSEEISTLLQFTLEDYNGTDVPEADDLILQTNWAFNGNRNRKFVIDYRLNFDWDPEARNTSHGGRFEYQWQTASRDRLRLGLFNRVIPRQHHLESKERLTVTGIHPWSDAPPEDSNDFGFLIYHETAWVFEDAGHLKGYLAIGLGERDEEFTNGWEIGLEAEFRF